jgi:hypothetical protein
MRWKKKSIVELPGRLSLEHGDHALSKKHRTCQMRNRRRQQCIRRGVIVGEPAQLP